MVEVHLTVEEYEENALVIETEEDEIETVTLTAIAVEIMTDTTDATGTTIHTTMAVEEETA